MSVAQGGELVRNVAQDTLRDKLIKLQNKTIADKKISRIGRSAK